MLIQWVTPFILFAVGNSVSRKTLQRIFPLLAMLAIADGAWILGTWNWG